jgi:hypothetical protein
MVVRALYADDAKSFDNRLPNETVTNLVGVCRQKAKAAADTNARSVDLLHEALASTLELYSVWHTEPSARWEVERLLRENEISVDGRTKNRITPIVKLVFGAFCNRSNINRNAAALKYAFDQGVNSIDLTRFLIASGGIARCAAMEARTRNSRSRNAATQALSATLDERREAAVPISVPSAISLPAGRMFSLLVERGENDELRFLGASVEDARTSRRYLLGSAET